MPQLTVTLPDGRAGTVNVDDSFIHLSASQQEATVNEIAHSLSPNDGFGADLQAGAHDALGSLGSGVQALGSLAGAAGWQGGRNALTAAGQAVRNAAPAMPQGYADRGGNLIHDIGQGNFSRAAGDALHGAVRLVPEIAGTIGAGLVSDGASVPAEIGAGALGGVSSLGAVAQARANANGRSVPNAADAAIGIPAGIVGALAMGSGGAIGQGEGVAAQALGRTGGRLLGRTLGGAVAGAGTTAATEAGTSLAGGNGLSGVSPSDIGNAAIEGGVLGGAMALPGAARDGLGGVGASVMSRLPGRQPATIEQAQARDAAGRLYDDTAANFAANGKGSKDPTVIANVAKRELATQLQTNVRKARDLGLMDQGAAQDWIELINRRALPKNNSITSGGDDGTVPLFDQLQGRTDPHLLPSLNHGVRTLDEMSEGSFLNQRSGPFRAAGALLGNTVGHAVIFNPHNVAGRMGQAIGGGIGGKIDAITGLAAPKILLQRMAAARYLANAGEEPLGNPMPALQTAAGAMNDVGPVLAAAKAKAAARAALEAEYQRSQESAANTAWLDHADSLKRAAQAAAKKEADLAAMQAQARAQAAQNETPEGQPVAPVAPEIEAYLNGKLQDPSLLPAGKLGALQNEQSIQNQRLANARAMLANDQRAAQVFARARAAEAQQQEAQVAAADKEAAAAEKARQQVEDTAARAAATAEAARQRQAAAEEKARQKAEAAKPENIAQAALNKRAIQNEADLQAANMLPEADVSDTASNAAVRTAMLRARRIANAASRGSRAADRISVGLPPEAIDESTAANNVRSRAATPALVPNTREDVATALRNDDGVRPAFRLERRPAWSAYVAHSNPAITHDIALQAAQQAEAAGHVAPRTAAALREHQGSADPLMLKQIQRHARALVGETPPAIQQASARVRSKSADVDRNGVPIKNRMAYAGAIANNRATVENLAAAANSAGLPHVAAEVRKIGYQINAPAAKMQEATRFVMGLHADERAVAAKFFTDALLMHGRNPKE